VALLGGGQAAEGWVVEQFYPHLPGRERSGQMCTEGHPPPFPYPASVTRVTLRLSFSR
jgi:hypothetical protein